MLWLLAALAATGVLLAVPADSIRATDFPLEAWPAYQRLTAGDVAGFFERAPGYLGFALLVGAPAALLGDQLDAGPVTVLYLSAAPGVLALSALAAWLAAVMRRRGSRGWWLVLALCAAGPAVRFAVVFGHPEDLLAAAASVGAVLVALRGRPNAAVLLLVVAVVAKQWALLAVLPTVIAAPERHRMRVLVLAALTAGAVVTAETLLHATARGAAFSTGTTGADFKVRHIWWPLALEAPGGGRVAPPWLALLAHPLIIAATVPTTAAWWWLSRRRPLPAHDALALLALAFLLRNLLDPWNQSYYHLPLILALVAWEVRRGARYPWLGLMVTFAVTLSFGASLAASGGAREYVTYLAWTLPLLAYLVTRLYIAPSWGRRRRPEWQSPSLAVAASAATPADG